MIHFHTNFCFEPWFIKWSSSAISRFARSSMKSAAFLHIIKTVTVPGRDSQLVSKKGQIHLIKMTPMDAWTMRHGFWRVISNRVLMPFRPTDDLGFSLRNFSANESSIASGTKLRIFVFRSPFSKSKDHFGRLVARFSVFSWCNSLVHLRPV